MQCTCIKHAKSEHNPDCENNSLNKPVIVYPEESKACNVPLSLRQAILQSKDNGTQEARQAQQVRLAQVQQAQLAQLVQLVQLVQEKDDGGDGPT
jgi:hypothetical protein